MKTGIATAIFLATVICTLILYYIKFGRKEDPLEFLEEHSLAITILLAFFVFTIFLALGFKAVLLFLAFFLLYFLLLLSHILIAQVATNPAFYLLSQASQLLGFLSFLVLLVQAGRVE